ncbi:hypothetical protein [Schlesneria sp. DSM 10557]|uniref:hypothetical protein n=1 Tax=Schlesneria sp. DSM 10557 TaxID=3044399 RepID=UPI0035A13C74
MVTLSPAILWLFRRSEPRETEALFFKKILYVIPSLVVGGISSVNLSVNGGLLSEWLIPAFVVLAAAFIAPTIGCMRAYSTIILVIGIGLCAEGLILRESRYTSNPQVTAGASAAHSKAILSTIRNELEEQTLPSVESPRPLNELVGREIPCIGSMRVMTQWHTPVTRLFRIERCPQKIWVVGHDGTTPQLEMQSL